MTLSIFDVCDWTNPEEVRFKFDMQQALRDNEWREELAPLLARIRFVQENIADISKRKACTATLEGIAARLEELTR